MEAEAAQAELQAKRKSRKKQAQSKHDQPAHKVASILSELVSQHSLD